MTAKSCCASTGWRAVAKEAAKRWASTRLLASLSPRSLDRYLRELMVFSRWLGDRDVVSPGSITHELLEDYMLFVRTRPWGAVEAATAGRGAAGVPGGATRGRLVGLPRTAVIQFGEMPRLAFRPPRGLDTRLFDQIIDRENLARLGSEQHAR
jgi:hypothetical protein